MAPPPLLSLRNIHLTFGGTALLEGAELQVGSSERLCVVGRNGSGKSTLLKIAAGLVDFDTGERFVQPGSTLRYLPQEPDFSGFETTLAYVEAGLTSGDDAYRALYLLEQLGLSGQENPHQLSGGEARRAALARVLAPEPDILLLDEPTNHLDLPTILWLESELKSMRSALVLISHDRRFLENLSHSTLWLDRGTSKRLDKGFADFEDWRDEVLVQEERDRHKLDRKIAMELDWVRYGVTGRRKRNMGRMAGLAALREQRRAQRQVIGQIEAQITQADASGTLVLEAKKIAKSYGERLIVDNFSLRLLRGERLALVGPNGAGKTTLLKLMTGALEPDRGSIRLGANLSMTVLDQRRDQLKEDQTLSDVLTDGRGDSLVVGDTTRHVASYMKDFLFLPEQMHTPVRTLSGGERGRLLLAKAFARPSNLLILDEPTNDLDLETLDLLQDLLADYAGTVLLVSHDRDFIDRVATLTLLAEGDGVFTVYAGGYQDMLAQRGEQGLVPTQATLVPQKQKNQTKSPTNREAPALRGKMSFKDKHALQTLPIEISRLEAEISKLNDKLCDGALASNASELALITKEMGQLQSALADAESRWLELEMLREELET
jgi:ABC transport system ATP-binding/permease protein